MNYIDENEYKLILDRMPICCVDILLYNENNEILLVKRKNKPAKGKFWFPGGRILKNETLINAAKRKIKEEINVDINELKYLLTDETIFNDSPFENIEAHTINIVFYGKIESKRNIKLDNTSDSYIFKKDLNIGVDNNYLLKCFKTFKIIKENE